MKLLGGIGGALLAVGIGGALDPMANTSIMLINLIAIGAFLLGTVLGAIAEK